MQKLDECRDREIYLILQQARYGFRGLGDIGFINGLASFLSSGPSGSPEQKHVAEFSIITPCWHCDGARVSSLPANCWDALPFSFLPLRPP